MKSIVENHGNKFQRKHKSGRRTKNLSFFIICDLRKQKTIKGHIFLNIKLKKQIYEDRYNIFRNQGYDTKRCGSFWRKKLGTRKLKLKRKI